MNYVTRAYTHFTTVQHRPRIAIVLHDTEGTSDLTTAQSAGSWHWLLGRQGTIYRDVPEDLAAWHVARCDEWQPGWLLKAPPHAGVSDANYCTIGIELVSHQSYRDAGEPYTAAQYASLRALLADLRQRYQRDLPIVTHGQLQLDRTDPVAFDFARAGLRWNARLPGYEPLPTPPTPIPPVEEPAMLTDDQARDVAALLWAQRQQVFMGGFAIPDAWLRELRAGRYRGLPQGAELDGPDGTKVQAFDAGVAVWVPASGVTWNA